MDGKSSAKVPKAVSQATSWPSFCLPGRPTCNSSSEEHGFASVSYAALLQPGALSSVQLTPQAAAQDALELGSLRHGLLSQFASPPPCV